MIDYARVKREHPKLKAMLTRAVNSGRQDKVVAACTAAVDAWYEWGTWPDDWSRWQRALDDVFPWNQSPELAELES